MHPLISINATTLGHVAFKILQTETSAKIFGISSKGMYAITKDSGVLFISRLSSRGPLTINISEDMPISKNADAGLQLSPTRVGCPQLDFEIWIKPNTPIWHPSLPGRQHTDTDHLFKRGKVLEDQMSYQYPDKLSCFSFSNSKTGKKNSVGIFNPSKLTQNLSTALSTRDENTIYASLTRFLGLGEGLTPSGDDFICGFLLASGLWQETLYSQLDLGSIGKRIAAVAKERTNTLSANLIACAATGSADERIINCLRWLSRIENSTPFHLEELLSYGNSSGADVLAGILSVIQFSPGLTNN